MGFLLNFSDFKYSSQKGSVVLGGEQRACWQEIFKMVLQAHTSQLHLTGSNNLITVSCPVTTEWQISHYTGHANAVLAFHKGVSLDQPQLSLEIGVPCRSLLEMWCYKDKERPITVYFNLAQIWRKYWTDIVSQGQIQMQEKECNNT